MGNSLLITHTYLPRVGGRENYYHHLFSQLAPQAVIVTPDQTGDYAEFDQQYALPVVRVGPLSDKWFRWGRPGRAKWLRSLVPLCRQHRIRVVHCGLVLPDGLSGWLLAQTLGLPYVVYTHGKEILEHAADPKTAPLMQQALEGASRVVCNSHYTGELLRDVGVSPGKIVRLCPGVDAQAWSTAPAAERLAALRQRHGLGDRPLILTVTRLIERKGCDVMMRAMGQILAQCPEAVYLIVGEGPERSRLEALRDELGLQNSVIFAGAVSDEDLLAYYYAAQVFAMISRQPAGSHEVEGFGIVYLEANACGLPVVAGRSGGVPDAVVDGETGYLVDPEDPQAVAIAVGRLLADPDLRQRLGSQGRQRAEQDFSWRQAGDRLRHLIAEVAAETPPRSLPVAALRTVPLLLQRHLFES